MGNNKIKTSPHEFWRIMEDHVTDKTLSVSMRKMIIDNIDSMGNIAVTEAGTNQLMDENYARLVLREPLIGDSVLVAEIPGRGKTQDPTRVVLGIVQTTPYDYDTGGGDPGPGTGLTQNEVMSLIYMLGG